MKFSIKISVLFSLIFFIIGLIIVSLVYTESKHRLERQIRNNLEE